MFSASRTHRICEAHCFIYALQVSRTYYYFKGVCKCTYNYNVRAETLMRVIKYSIIHNIHILKSSSIVEYTYIKFIYCFLFSNYYYYWKINSSFRTNIKINIVEQYRFIFSNFNLASLLNIYAFRSKPKYDPKFQPHHKINTIYIYLCIYRHLCVFAF